MSDPIGMSTRKPVDMADSIRQALEFKERGNAAFKAGDYEKALEISNYHTVMLA